MPNKRHEYEKIRKGLNRASHFCLSGFCCWEQSQLILSFSPVTWASFIPHFGLCQQPRHPHFGVILEFCLRCIPMCSARIVVLTTDLKSKMKNTAGFFFLTSVVMILRQRYPFLFCLCLSPMLNFSHLLKCRYIDILKSTFIVGSFEPI